MAPYQFPAELSSWIAMFALTLDPRVQQMLMPLFVGVLFGRERRTVTSWLRVLEVGEDFERWYRFLGSVGRAVDRIAKKLILLLLSRLPIGERVLFALDDSPTKRYGPKVEGAGVHHNPTPGPANQKHLYGHVWVTIALVCRHAHWGTIALPIMARLYVRIINLPVLKYKYGWQFRTKLELGAELVEMLAGWLKHLGKSVWVVADGAYCKREFLRRAAAAGVIVVSRLRKDAALFDTPPKTVSGKRGRGRPRIYGKNRISLAKRAGQSRGWKTIEVVLYGERVVKRYKSFLATYPPAGGLILVVLVKNDDGSWVAFCCTDTTASVADVLEAVADRSGIEQVFHDVKEVHGSGQQQLRNVWRNVAAWNMNLWMYTLTELWAWDRPASELRDRSDSPWDDPSRRPSHANRCNALRGQSLEMVISQHCRTLSLPAKIVELIGRLAKRAA